MAIVGGGGEMWACIPSDSTVIEVTTAGSFDSGFARCALWCDKASNYVEFDPSGTLTEAWAHFDIVIRSGGSGSTAHPRVVWLDGAGVERVRLTHRYDTDALALQYDVGAGWVTAGSITLDLELPARQTMDLRVVCNSASGSLTLFIAGTERIASGTVDLSAITALNKFRSYGATISGSIGMATYTSQVILASESTIGMRGMSGHPSAAGANTAWTGDHTSVDETAYTDADFIFSSTNGQRETYAVTYVGSMAGYTPRALIAGARGKYGGSGPQNLQITVVSGATTDDSASILLGLGYTANVNVWEDDPNTTLDWTSANIVAAQVGVEANT